jgi:hypothetical protein
MVEHPSKPGPLICKRPVPDKFFYEQVKNCVIGRRNGTPHTGRALFRNALFGEMLGIFQQFIG